MADYVDNKEFVTQLVAYKERLATNADERVPEYVGMCILEICKRFSTRPNFYGYSYRDEMVSDAVENCLMYVTNFDPAKSSNAFSYFTQIAFFAFLRRIAREKKQSYIRHKLITDMPIDAFTSQDSDDAELSQNLHSYLQSHSTFDCSSFEKKMSKGTKKPKPLTALEELMLIDVDKELEQIIDAEGVLQ